MKTLAQIEEAIRRKEDLIKLLQGEILELNIELTKDKSKEKDHSGTVKN